MDRCLVNMTAAPTAAMVSRTRLRPKVSARPRPRPSSARSRKSVSAETPRCSPQAIRARRERRSAA